MLRVEQRAADLRLPDADEERVIVEVRADAVELVGDATPTSCRWSAGPMPESISSCGDP
jgi:hypothetical protein